MVEPPGTAPGSAASITRHHLSPYPASRLALCRRSPAIPQVL